jgi:hypothetical protein
MLAGCASNPKLPMSGAIPGNTLPGESVESVRYSENVKAYNIGRYVDPNNSLTMHERHEVYRVETTAKWNLHPNGPAAVPIGPVVQIIDAAHKDAPTTPEIIAEVNRQKAATQTVIQQGERLNQTLTQLSTALTESRQVNEQNLELRKDFDLTKQRLDLLEAELRSQQKGGPARSGTPETSNPNW